jgi:hypothetical protein
MRFDCHDFHAKQILIRLHYLEPLTINLLYGLTSVPLKLGRIKI